MDAAERQRRHREIAKGEGGDFARAKHAALGRAVTEEKAKSLSLQQTLMKKNSC
jgi:hypothetical protein